MLETEIIQLSESEQYRRIEQLLIEICADAYNESGAQWNKINERLDVDPAPLATVWLVALLRYSFTFRKYLPNWPVLLGKVRIELDKRGKNSARILVGLDQPILPTPKKQG
jgi:hypothetical protein